MLIQAASRCFYLWVILFSAIVLMACLPSAVILKGELPLTAPRVVVIGEPLHLSIGPVANAAGKPVGLVMISTQGPKVYNSTFNADTATFDIPITDLSQPGYLTFVAVVDNARGQTIVHLQAERTTTVNNHNLHSQPPLIVTTASYFF